MPVKPTVALRWASSSAVSYNVVFSGGGVTIAFGTNDTQHNFTGLAMDTPYRISVVPRNQFCQGEGVELEVSSGSGKLKYNTDML